MSRDISCMYCQNPSTNRTLGSKYYEAMMISPCLPDDCQLPVPQHTQQSPIRRIIGWEASSVFETFTDNNLWLVHKTIKNSSHFSLSRQSPPAMPSLIFLSPLPHTQQITTGRMQTLVLVHPLSFFSKYHLNSLVCLLPVSTTRLHTPWKQSCSLLCIQCLYHIFNICLLFS